MQTLSITEIKVLISLTILMSIYMYFYIVNKQNLSLIHKCVWLILLYFGVFTTYPNSTHEHLDV